MSRELYEILKEYAASDFYPWHMPGHKRHLGEMENPFSFDITEIEGFDDLHHPDGILKDAMAYAAQVYGSKKSYFLVNGSSCGILAAISAAVQPGKKLLLARNCHKSAYYAAFLQQAEVTYLYPQLEPDGFYGQVQAADVERALDADPEIAAVMLVSPGYEGITSDIEAIAKVVHTHGCTLLVDEAHGAHLPFCKETTGISFPVSALEQGADLVIQSLHKTLPSLTQTAILHVRQEVAEEESYVNLELLEFYLRVYQSSSPSYLLMASIDHCIHLMAGEKGKELVMNYCKNLSFAREKLQKNLKVLRLYQRETDSSLNSFYDPSKFVILTVGSMDGTQLAEVLRKRYHLESEMHTDHYVILMSSPADTSEGFVRLTAALLEIDADLVTAEKPELDANLTAAEKQLVVQLPAKAPEKKMRMHQAMTAPKQSVLLGNAAGQICHDFVYIYPPGIPLLVPGEVIQKEHLDIIEAYQAHHLEVHGVSEGKIETVASSEQLRLQFA